MTWLKSSVEFKSLPELDVLHECLAYDAETGVFTWKKRPETHFKNAHRAQAWNKRFAGKPTCTQARGGYAGCTIEAVRYYAHRIAFKMHHGREPRGEIDHINGNKLDNRASNLREVSQAENHRNICLARHNTSGVLGVSYRAIRQRWRAFISVDNCTIELGEFSRFEDAVKARARANERYGFHANHGRARA